jgi:hypothetical protein
MILMMFLNYKLFKITTHVPNPITAMTIGINRSVKKVFLFPLPEIKPIKPTKNIITRMNPRNIKNSIL